MKSITSTILGIFCLSTMAISQTLDDKIDSLIGLMSEREKIFQITQYGSFNTLDNERLNIPGLFMSDGPHGIKQGRSTSFPVGIAMAASWDTNLVRRIGETMGKEFWGKGIHQALGPTLDLCWNPLNGRSPESGGEDPFLCAEITSSLIKGIQSYPVIATAKHFNCVAMQDNRFHNDVQISNNMLMDHYGYNFRKAVQQANVFSVMNAFNLINGVNSAENAYLLDTILRQQWGFPHYVVSDWGAVWEASGALNAGTNICMGSYLYRDALPQDIDLDIVKVSQLNNMVKGVIRAKMLSGFMGYYPKGHLGLVNLPEHRELCREAGRKSIVLLKNENNILPLSKTSNLKIALIGPNANQPLLDGKGSSSVTPYYSITVKEGFEQALGAENVLYEKGCDINSSDTSSFSAARSVASQADYVVFVGGLDDTQEGEVRDRVSGSVDLPGKQSDLINELAKTNPNLISVIVSGGICAMNKSLDSIKGLLYAFYPGQEAGNAIADVVFGEYNPSGKLPVTMPVSDNQLPERNLNYNDDFGGGYRWFDRQNLTPEFAFGYGLSYTTFNYSNINIHDTTVLAGDSVYITFDVENTGSIVGEEVAQLYLFSDTSNNLNPVKQLRGFTKINLSPGEKKTVCFKLTPNEFYTFNPSTNQYEVKTGYYRIKAGGSSANLPLETSINITPAAAKPDLRISKLFTYPRYPVKGQPVLFLASVVNYGTGPSPDTIHKIEFRIGDEAVALSTNHTSSLKAGEMEIISADSSIFPLSDSNYHVTANFNPSNTIDECDEGNNSKTGHFTVFDSVVLKGEPVQNNIALNKPTWVSDYQDSITTGDMAVDGKRSTRWGVEDRSKDIQILSINLLDYFFIDSIKVQWCPIAYPERLKFEFKDTLDNWYTAKQINTAYSGHSTYTGFGDISTNRIRLKTLQKHTSWIPYSLYEIEVYGQKDSLRVVDTTNNVQPINKKISINRIYPNPFSHKLFISYNIQERQHAELSIFDITGKKIKTLVNKTHNPGTYNTTWFGVDAFGKQQKQGPYILSFSSPTYRFNKLIIKID